MSEHPATPQIWSIRHPVLARKRGIWALMQGMMTIVRAFEIRAVRDEL